MKNTRLPPATHHPRSGFSLIEVLISVTLITVAVVGAMSSITSTASLGESNRESALAYRAAQRRLEQVQASAFEDAYALYNADPLDNPAGIAAPGPHFDVAGLAPQDSDADGRVGRVIFPISIGAGPALVINADLEEPGYDVRSSWPTGVSRSYPPETDISSVRDLDMSSGYLLLPVRVEIRWTGASGDRSITVESILCPR